MTTNFTYTISFTDGRHVVYMIQGVVGAGGGGGGWKREGVKSECDSETYKYSTKKASVSLGKVSEKLYVRILGHGMRLTILLFWCNVFFKRDTDKVRRGTGIIL
jgi:hypothetical protein